MPPLPAASRPSNTTTTRKPFCLTQSCSTQSSTSSTRSAVSYIPRASSVDHCRLHRPPPSLKPPQDRKMPSHAPPDLRGVMPPQLARGTGSKRIRLASQRGCRAPDGHGTSHPNDCLQDDEGPQAPETGQPDPERDGPT